MKDMDLNDIEEQLRGAARVIAILVERLGGEATVTPEDLDRIRGFRLVRIDDPEDRSLTFRLERRPT
jgi:hypothetical protein